MADKFYCKWCGQDYSSVMSLTHVSCSHNPDGKQHELYEGCEKPEYTCKYCGLIYKSLVSLTLGNCKKSPHNKHHPAM